MEVFQKSHKTLSKISSNRINKKAGIVEVFKTPTKIFWKDPSDISFFLFKIFEKILLKLLDMKNELPDKSFRKESKLEI